MVLWGTPVSYTHLDVYKRQVPATGLGLKVGTGVGVGATVANGDGVGVSLPNKLLIKPEDSSSSVLSAAQLFTKSTDKNMTAASSTSINSSLPTLTRTLRRRRRRLFPS